MSKGKKIYFLVLLLITIIVTTFYFSYAIFSNTKEEHGKLNIVAGTLNYKIESSELDSDSITLEANTSKEIKIKLTSLNEVSSKYELYYILDKTNDKVSVGYSKDTKDNVLGTIEGSSSKVISIVVRNDSDTSSKVTFKVLGGLLNNELALKDGNSLNQEVVLCNYGKGYVWNFDYTGGEQEFTTPCSGNYKVELWGAQGGSISGVAYNSDGSIRNSNLTYVGGKGAYTTGLINLNKNKILYVYVGGSPSQINTTLVSGGNYVGGFNGGESITSGQEIYGAPGGGATDIRLFNGNWNDFSSLKSRIMVAAGGGGANFRNDGYGEGNGGEGGNLVGIKGYEALTPGSYFRSDFSDGYNIGNGGTQTAGGVSEQHYLNGEILTTTAHQVWYGSFGGANNICIHPWGTLIQSGSGGGYYSGASAAHGGAGGGSSFISGYNGCNAIDKSSTIDNIIHTGQANHYSGYIFNKSIMIAGNDTMPTHNNSITMVGNSGNGYARITYLGN